MGTFRQPPSPHIGGWQPLEARKLPPDITAVPVDDPPFGMPNPMWQVLASWQPGVPIRQVFGKNIPEAAEVAGGSGDSGKVMRQMFIPNIVARRIARYR